MKVGIDMGGTHTDGVLIKDEQIINTTKLPTAQTNLTKTILTTCQQLVNNYNPQAITQITLSTTLATNIIAQGNYPPIGLILIPGPGLSPNLYNYNFPYQTVSGYIDHRGRETKPLDAQEVKQAVNKLIQKGVQQVGICGKFATRNPQQEEQIKKLIKDNSSQIKQVTVSHQLTGNLNFPRRINTTYLNCIIQSTHQKFSRAVKEGLQQLNIKAPIYLLKADGGTIPLSKTNKQPIITANSGPAASIMGIMAANPPAQTTIGLDIGGTTTDISLFVNQEPLFKPNGIEIKDYKTLVRGLYNVSLPCGGDSLVQVKEGRLKVGPTRKGPAAAFGGKHPTLTDALVIKEKMAAGNQQSAKAVLQPLAHRLNFTVSKTADKIIEQFCQNIQTKLNNLIGSLNQQPVYTINELLSETNLQPQHLIGIGGPARTLIPILAENLNLSYTVPEYAEVSNAVGAVLSRVTTQCSLYADTAEGYYNIPELGIEKNIKGNFNLSTAREKVTNALQDSLSEGTTVEITSEKEFNIVRRFRTLGKIIKVTAQVKPGLVDSCKLKLIKN